MKSFYQHKLIIEGVAADILKHSDSPAPYGYCPTCGAMGASRERRRDGDDTCENNHKYPSKDSLEQPIKT